MRTIILNSLNLTANNYHVTGMKDDLGSEISINSYIIPRADKAVSVSAELPPRAITIEGYILTSTETALIQKIDALKQAVAGQGLSLALTYTDIERRYVVDCTSVAISEVNINHAFFIIQLVANDPTSYSPTTTTASYTAQTADISEVINFEGSAPPLPTITLEVNSETDLTSIAISNSESANTLTITEAFDADDVLVINFAERKVLLNGTEVDYTGTFPEFAVGNNTLAIDLTGTAFNVDVSVAYLARWL